MQREKIQNKIIIIKYYCLIWSKIIFRHNFLYIYTKSKESYRAFDTISWMKCVSRTFSTK